MMSLIRHSKIIIGFRASAVGSVNARCLQTTLARVCIVFR